MKDRRACGALLLELSLTLPVFLFVILEVWWIALALRARSSLSLSIGDAVRLGVTRGDPANLNPGPLTFVDSWIANGSMDPRLAKLLYQEGKPNEPSIDMSHVDSVVSQPIFGLPLRSLPRTYTYALVYMHEYMRLRVGGNLLRYPCSDRPNCLECTFLNPDSLLSKATPTAQYAGGVPSKSIIAMRCSFVPDFGLLNPLVSLGAMLSSSPTSTSEPGLLRFYAQSGVAHIAEK